MVVVVRFDSEESFISERITKWTVVMVQVQGHETIFGLIKTLNAFSSNILWFELDRWTDPFFQFLKLHFLTYCEYVAQQRAIELFFGKKLNWNTVSATENSKSNIFKSSHNEKTSYTWCKLCSDCANTRIMWEEARVLLHVHWCTRCTHCPYTYYYHNVLLTGLLIK